MARILSLFLIFSLFFCQKDKIELIINNLVHLTEYNIDPILDKKQLQTLLVYKDSIKNIQKRAQVFNIISSQLYYSDANLSKSLSDSAHKIYSQLDNKFGILQSLRLLSIATTSLGESGSAERYCLEAIKYSKDLGKSLYLLNNYRNLSIIYKNSYKYSDALIMLKKALKVSLSTEIRYWSMRTYADIANLLVLVKFNKESMHYFNKSQELAKNYMENFFSRIFVFRGISEFETGNYSEAKQLLEKSIEIYKSNNPDKHEQIYFFKVANYYLAKIYYLSNREKDFLQLIKYSLQLDQNNTFLPEIYYLYMEYAYSKKKPKLLLKIDSLFNRKNNKLYHLRYVYKKVKFNLKHRLHQIDQNSIKILENALTQIDLPDLKVKIEKLLINYYAEENKNALVSKHYEHLYKIEISFNKLLIEQNQKIKELILKEKDEYAAELTQSQKQLATILLTIFLILAIILVYKYLNKRKQLIEIEKFLSDSKIRLIKITQEKTSTNLINDILKKNRDSEPDESLMVNKKSYPVLKQNSLNIQEEIIFKFLFKLTLNAVFIYDVKLRKKIYVNERYFNLLSYSVEEIYQNENIFNTIIHPDEIKKLDIHRKLLAKAEDGEVIESHLRFLNKERETKYILLREVILDRDRLGKPERTIGEFIDLTNTQISNDSLENIKDDLFMSQDIAKMASFEIDFTNRNVNASQNLFKLMNLIPKRYLEWIEFITIVPITLRKQIEKRIDKSIESFTAINIEFQSNLSSDSHSIWLKLSINPFYDKQKNKKRIVGIIQDISSQIFYEEQLRETLDKEKRLNEKNRLLVKNLENKNEELESIVYVTSHDLRSPLVNIHGFSKEIEESVLELKRLLSHKNFSVEELNQLIDENIIESFTYIKSSTEKMDNLLKGLLKLSRLGRIKLELTSIDMNRLIADIIHSFQYQLQKINGEVIVNDLLPCTADKSQINQVFSNLLDNAIKYRDKSRQLKIQIFVTTTEKFLEYHIKDNGLGIAKNHQQKVFELFHRLDPFHEESGEGLGLTIINRIISKHNGYLYLISEPGQGSEFIISIPKHQGNA